MYNKKIVLHTEPFHYIEVRNLWSAEERTEMFEEMLFLEKHSLLQSPEHSASATYIDGTYKKNNRSSFIDEICRDRESSKILRYNRELFGVLDSEETQKSWFFNGIHRTTDSTLVSYYEDATWYRPHRDKTIMTAVSWFFKEPKKFKGGDITFTDYNLTFEVTNDLTILFPSNIRHEVSEVSIDNKYVGKQYGRFTLSQFIWGVG